MTIGLLISTFGAGMLATINPCGFAMLPAYISYFLNLSDDHPGSKKVKGKESITSTSMVIKAIQVGGITTAGFIVLFVSTGILISMGAKFIISFIPWVGFIIGFLLLIMGIWVITGHHLSFPGLPAIQYKGKRTLGSFFIYGISYGLASLTCTLPIFLAVIGSVFTNGQILQGIGQFVAYSLGMGLIIISLTISLAFFKGAMVKRMRQIIPYVERISAILLIGAGGYLIYYWLVVGRLAQRIG